MGRFKTQRLREALAIAKQERKQAAYIELLKLASALKQKPKLETVGCRTEPHYPFSFWERRKLALLTGPDKASRMVKKAYVLELKQKYRKVG